MKPKVVVIVGGGFGGIKTALELEEKEIPGIKIVLISDRTHFEYHATLYKVLSGHSPIQSCIPLREIFEGKKIEIIEDRIANVDLESKKLTGELGFDYYYDTLVLSVGSEVSYFNTAGLEEYSYSFSSVSSVIKLKKHLHSIFDNWNNDSSDDKTSKAHILIVGGGVTGCEVCGELATYLKKLAKKHSVDPSFVTIDLIHAGSRLVPNLPEDFSQKIENRLHKLGVNIYLNRRVQKEDIESVYLPDMQMKTKTLIWTAGVKTNCFYEKINGIELDEKHKVKVNRYLQLPKYKNVFVIGDPASVQYSGMAQSALHQGEYVAEAINRIYHMENITEFKPIRPEYLVPVGNYWAASMIGDMKFFGLSGWFFRKIFDLRFFLSILPFRKAVAAFRSESQLWETCPICSQCTAAS